jgi:hypothetical protein
MILYPQYRKLITSSLLATFKFCLYYFDGGARIAQSVQRLATGWTTRGSGVRVPLE